MPSDCRQTVSGLWMLYFFVYRGIIAYVNRIVNDKIKNFGKFDGFIDAIKEVVPIYNPFGEIEISIKEWTEIGKIILTKDSLSQEVYNEANEWLTGVFAQYACFTILGL